ncbi:transient receptor potential cation channel subfamily A member 1-like [Anoplophora glabripennis]|uniref:transient receptor potential cation channel subfamily A member 1-like n=1 Tax=Anoplophora glabripennis TaxID=217634 RepID=UPI000874C087|nr:transient receptor potential cation channel subfamily A member 1-like [Anoplophora glabripennis]
MVYSYRLSVEDEDVEQGPNATKIMTDRSFKGKRDQLLKLVVGKHGENVSHAENIQRIQRILETNKNLLTYQYWEDNKIRSVLHIVKYSSKMRYDYKQQVINTIIDVGCRLFKFSENSSFRDKCLSLFFAAAKSDLEDLREIIIYFRNNDLTKIYDTREGDTIISFMVKFGDHFHGDFFNCLKLLLEEGIDVERVDYYKNNVRGVIRKEKQFLEKNKVDNKYIDKLKEICDYVDTFSKLNQDFNSRINYKYKLFQGIINEQKNLKHILKQKLVDSDDGENTLLQLAIIKNNVEITKELLNAGANPNRVVQGRNEEVPLVLAAKLQRDKIFQEILINKDIEISEIMFVKFVKELKRKFLNSLLEIENLNVDFEYKGKTPLHYAIMENNKKAVQSLLQRGSRVDETCLQYINPKDLEDYFNSCIKFDNFRKDFEEGDFKLFLVFDFFIISFRKHSKKQAIENSAESTQLFGKNKISPEEFNSELAIVENIGNIKRLKHLLEHPLVYIYIMLKWHSVLKYYYCITIAKSVFYIMMGLLICSFNYYLATVLLIIQLIVVYYNYSEFKLEFRRYTLHFILEFLIFICLAAIYILKSLNNDKFVKVINEISAFIIIFISVSILLTIGYHLKLSKWVAMAKRIFRNFSILLLFFMVPISAFATSFMLLSETDNGDFSSFYGSLFKTFIMIVGEIGDVKFTGISSYLIFVLFTLGVAIMLLNFWIGIAVADINEIKKQSTIVAFQQVISYVRSLEKLYNFIFDNKLYSEKQKPSLRSRITLKKFKRYKYCYGVDFYMNSQKQFKNNKYFRKCKIPIKIVSKIKLLYEEDKTKSFDSIVTKLNEIKQLLNDHINQTQ